MGRHHPAAQAAEAAVSDGELPEGWALVKLSEVISPSKEKIEPSERPNAPYLSLEHIESHGARIIGQGKGADVGSTKAVFHAGDVLYGKLRPYLNKVCVPDFDGICSTDILVFPKSACLENRFLMRFLMQPDVVEYANHNSNGIQLPRISFEALGRLPLPLPPVAEQQRIVAKVERLLAGVNAARQRLAKVPAILKRFRQSVLAAACSGRLTADWRAPISAPVVEEASESLDVPEVPDSWVWKRLSAVAQIKGGVTKGRKFNGKSTIMVPYLRVANVQDGYLDLAEIKQIEVLPEERQKYALEPGDILFTEGGDRDKLGRGTVWRGEVPGCIHQNHIFRARLITGDATPEYLSLATKSDFSRQYFFHNASQTVNLASLNLTMLSGLPIPVPPLAEQHEIVRRVEALFRLADAIEKRVSAATGRAEKLTQAILAKAFRGELVPTEAELARREGRRYEPASALLECIRAPRRSSRQASRLAGQRKHRESCGHGCKLKGTRGDKDEPYRLKIADWRRRGAARDAAAW